jgi:imidazolonepropionase-like amidohydrolase
VSARAFVSGAVALVLATAAPLAAQAPPLVLAGATLIDGTGAPPVADAVVVVRDGRIACAGPRAACAVPADAGTLDVRGRWVTPGFIDAHVHYSQTGWADGRPDSHDARDRFPYDRTVARLRDPAPFYRANLCTGVTATFDVGGYAWTWGLRSAAAASGRAPHVAAAGPLLSTSDHWVNVPGERQFLHIASDSAVDAGARYLLANRTDAIKVWYLVNAQMPDTAVWVGRLERAAGHARRAGVPLIVHATTLWPATHAVRVGARLLVHGVSDRPVDDAFLAYARAAGTVYTPTLVVRDGYRHLRARRFPAELYGDALRCVDPATRAKAFLTDSLPGRPDDATLALVAEQAAHTAAIDAENVRRVHAAGIPVAVGTDAGNPLTLHGPSFYLEMEALQAAGLSPHEVLVAATRNGALAMGRVHDLGTVEAGKVADLLVLDADPTADIRNARRVVYVLRGGTVHRRSDLEFPDAELVSPLGLGAYHALPDTAGALAAAEAALAAGADADRLLAAAAALAGLWRYGDAIRVYDRAIATAPGDWRAYRFRGHRRISLRRFDAAVRDLERARELAPHSFDVSYHLALAYYLRGEFAAAADEYARCMGLAEDPAALALLREGRLPQGFRACMHMAEADNDRVAMAEWRWRALRRAGRDAEAARLLDTIRPDMQVTSNRAYLETLLYHRGLLDEATLMDPATLTENRFETLGYAIAVGHLLDGRPERARRLLDAIVERGDRWNAFGFIAAEADLLRMGVR